MCHRLPLVLLALALVFLLSLLVLLVLPVQLILHLLVRLMTWLFLLMPVLVLALVLVLLLMAGLEACRPTYKGQTKTIMRGIAGGGQCWDVRKHISCEQQTKACHIIPHMCRFILVDKGNRAEVHVPQHTIPEKTTRHTATTHVWLKVYLQCG